jgi:hypothetical protein
MEERRLRRLQLRQARHQNKRLDLLERHLKAPAVSGTAALDGVDADGASTGMVPVSAEGPRVAKHDTIS